MVLELQLPPAPTALGPEAADRLAQEQANADATATASQDVPTADQSAQAARDGVTEPIEQLQGEGNEAVVAALDDRPPPDPEIEAFCERVRQVIRDKRPADEDALATASPDAAAREAGGQVQSQVQGGVSQAQSGYDSLQQDGAAPAGQQGAPLPETSPEAQGAPAMDAQRAAPDPISDEDTSLDNDTANADQQIEDAGMTTEPAALVEDGPIADARAARGELGAAAAEDVAAVRQRQQEAIAGARGNMAELQARAQEALAASRSTAVTGTSSQQGGMVESESQMRVRVGQEAERLFTGAQTTVRDLLRPLAENARARWDAELVPIKDTFRSDLREVEAAINERHSGVGGAIVSLWDSVTGLPAWVTRAYDRAETNFADSVCALIRDISRDVNAVLRDCERIVEKARTDIAALYDALPEGLQTWAAEQQSQMTARLDGLRGEVETARQTVRDGLIEQAGAAVDEVRREVAALRDKAKGLLGQIADAITAFLEDPARAIINGLLSLLGISPGAFWALIDKIGSVIDAIADDPMGFASNLVSALGKGFTQFFDNFGRHVLQGLVSWLFSGLGSVGVQVPTDLSLRSVITFFLQLMGLTWERIRRVLARHIGEQNVALIEQAWSILSTLISQGPAGIFEMIKDALDPQNLLNMVLETAASYLVERVIRAVSMRILGMLNPAGAILQAIELIYRVVSWVMNNAARIFALVETVVNGAADLVAGNIGGMANAVEGALARLVAPVIDFLAGLLGFGDLPDKIAQVIGGLQARVERVLDRVIGTIVAAARRALAAVGVGRPAESAAAGSDDGEIGETVRFSAGGEGHRLWVQPTPSGVSLKLASTEKTLVDHLRDFEGKVGNAGDRQEEIRGQIGVARGHASRIEGLGQQIVRTQIDTPERAALDNQIEGEERAVRPVLATILDAIGESTPERVSPVVVADFSTSIGWGGVPVQLSRVEMVRQLQMQTAGINAMVVADWLRNRLRYAERRDTQRAFGVNNPSGRDPRSGNAQANERVRIEGIARQALQRPLSVGTASANTADPTGYTAQFVVNVHRRNPGRESTGFTAAEAATKAESWMSRQHALHSPDQVAGGAYDDLTGMGQGDVNSAIGYQWGAGNANRLEAGTRSNLAAAGVAEALWRQVKMNVDLRVS